MHVLLAVSSFMLMLGSQATLEHIVGRYTGANQTHQPVTDETEADEKRKAWTIHSDVI
jgi:hypothetical protein